MGQEGSGKGIRRDFILDAGALIALERDNRRLRAILRRSLAPRSQVIIPASVLAQAWRRGPRSAPLAKWIGKSEVDVLDEDRAKGIGVRLGARNSTDVADAHVVSCAIERRAAVITSDPDDIEGLAEAGEDLVVIAV